MKSYVKYIVAIVLFAALFCGFYFGAPHVLYFHEQHHLFRWSTDYLTHMAHLRGPAYLLFAFVVQFSYYPALGAAVWASVLTLTYLMLQSIIFRLTGFRDLLQISVLVPAYLFSKAIVIEQYPATPMVWFCWIFIIWVVSMLIGRFLPWTRKKAKDTPENAESATETPEKKKSKTPSVAIWSPVLALIFMFIGYKAWDEAQLTGDIHESERVMLETEKAVREKNWPEVVERTNAWVATGRKNHLMSYFRSLGLYHTGQLYDHLFDYPQTFGIRALFFPWLGDKNQAEYGHYVFQDLGQLNEAHRWVFEAMVGWYETAPLLSHLAEYNIMMHRPAVADKFIIPLEQSTFYRDRARRLREYLAEGIVPGMHYAMEGVDPEPARWTNVINIGGETSFIMLKDPDNEMARQYLILSMMLAGNRDAVLRSLTTCFPPETNPELPRVVQEALILYRKTMGRDFISELGYKVSEQNEQRFRDYMKEAAKGKNARFTPDQRRSYWYYFQNVMPHVNNDFIRKAQTNS